MPPVHPLRSRFTDCEIKLRIGGRQTEKRQSEVEVARLEKKRALVQASDDGQATVQAGLSSWSIGSFARFTGWARRQLSVFCSHNAVTSLPFGAVQGLVCRMDETAGVRR